MSRLLSYYGDDFTGATDVMESLATHGVATVLFTRIPTPSEFVAFKDYAAFGLAGTSRSQSVTWMDDHLAVAFRWLKGLSARFCHYKVCSTFDSSPTIGNIGRAAEIGMEVFAQALVPLIVGAPQLQRYTFAGHLFANYLGQTYRIDRHPVMSRHPVTPMHEADLVVHLARQTALYVQLANRDWPDQGMGLLDVHDLPSQIQAGLRLLDLPARGQPFLIGSSGVEYALMKALAASRQPIAPTVFEALPPVDRLLAVSGSVSPTTERQIRYSLDHGFAGIAIDPLLLAGESRTGHIEQAVAAAEALLNQGRSVLAYTALGSATDAGMTLQTIPQARQKIGEGLGEILRRALQLSGVRRAIIAGGDSSSHALGQLDVHALTVRFPLPATPGSPLCTAHSATLAFDGMEIAMKGGQVGGDNYFVQLRDGMA